MVTFPDAERRRQLTTTRLYCLATEIQGSDCNKVHLNYVKCIA